MNATPTVTTVLSPRAFARAIGVSESSVKRWVDDGQIVCSRTAGGHRRIAISEALSFIRERQLQVIDPTALGLESAGGTPTATDIESWLQEADGQRIYTRLLARWSHGDELGAIFDGPMADALHRLGELWHHQDDGVLVEHRAISALTEALASLSMTLPRSVEGPVAVGAAPANDPYQLPARMASICLTDLGFQCDHLGPDTPLEVIEQAAAERSARLVWLSCTSTCPSVDRLRELGVRLAARGTALAVGGAATQDISLHLKEVFIGQRLGELLAFARGLLASRDHG